MKEHLMFFGKVALALLVINQIAPLQAIVARNYFSNGS